MALTKLQKDFVNKNCQRFFPKEMADILGCGVKVIRNYCYNNGFPYKTKRLTQEDINYIIDHHRKFTIDELANNLQTQKANIKRILRKKGLNINLKGIAPENKLTPTEQMIFDLICVNGVVKYDKLAECLIVARTTIVTHLNNIYKKTNSHSIAELIYKYYNGLIDKEFGCE